MNCDECGEPIAGEPIRVGMFRYHASEECAPDDLCDDYDEEDDVS